MRIDSIYLGSAPVFEPTAHVEDEGYRERATRECRAFIAQLRRQFGGEPSGCEFTVAEQPHDSGVYLSVNVQHDRDDLHACNWAYMVESKVPLYWDAEAIAELDLETAAVDEVSGDSGGGGGGGGGGS